MMVNEVYIQDKTCNVINNNNNNKQDPKGIRSTK